MDGPVVLVDAESDVERGLVTEWLRTHDVHPREVLAIDAKALAKPLATSRRRARHAGAGGVAAP
jgi:hypothetical protein